jgi:hypothetical protein
MMKKYVFAHDHLGAEGAEVEPDLVQLLAAHVVNIH